MKKILIKLIILEVFKVTQRYQISSSICFLLLFISINALAAPIRPVGPVDGTGLIHEITQSRGF
jgi:hypothetical protein